MPDFLKGCLFVGAAVVVGILAGLIVPSLVVDDSGGGETTASRDRVPPPPTMPDVVGKSLDVAEQRLERRDISHEAVGRDIFGYVPPMFEVCETNPAPGEPVRGTAVLQVELPGLCL